MVAILDEAIGNVTDMLERRGFMDNALVIFTTDVSPRHDNDNDDDDIKLMLITTDASLHCDRPTILIKINSNAAETNGFVRHKAMNTK